ncbi:hypothetical protein JCM3770_000218 [Rhodotorula araucariae]
MDNPPSDQSGPRDDTVLPPWIWLTLCILSLVCLLFVSFRRAKSLELYERAKDYVRQRLPFGSLHRGVRLSDQDLEANTLFPPSRPRSRSSPSGDDLSDTSSVHSADADLGDGVVDGDERLHASFSASPGGFPSRRAYTLDTRPARSLASSTLATLQRGAGGAAEALGWGTERGMRALRGEGEKSAGIARAFWGLRKGERAGGIKLGDNEAAGRHEESHAGTAAAPNRPEQASSRGGSLFDIGDDVETGDAVELPSQFTLSSQGSTPK